MVRKRSPVQFWLEAPKEVIMEDNFNELYKILYNENLNELEIKRKKTKRFYIIVIMSILVIMSFAMIKPFLAMVILIALIIICTLAIVMGIKKGIIKVVDEHEVQTNENDGQDSYFQTFKIKIIKPIIETLFEGARYYSRSGITREEYNKAGYKDKISRYTSEDLIELPIKTSKNVINLKISEVHTEKIERDSDGHIEYVTEFRGLAGYFIIPTSCGGKMYIRSNGSVSNKNENKVLMDMSEFEKLFDVESEDKIFAMRVLTSDVMTSIINLYYKCKYEFEISIIEDVVYIRIKTGKMFEPHVFKESLEYETLEKYYVIIKKVIDIVEQLNKYVLELEN